MSVFIQILIYRGGWFLFFICVRRIFCLNYVIYFICSFLSSFFPKKEERNEPKKEERNGCDHTDKNARITRLAFLRNICSAKAERIFRTFRKKSFDCVEKKYSRVIPVDDRTRFTVSLLAIFGMFFPFYADLMLWCVAGATRQYFMYDKIRSCFLSEFTVCRSGLPRSFFLLSGASFFFLSRKKGRKMRKNSLIYKNISVLLKYSK